MNTDRLFQSLSAMHPLPAEFREALESSLTYVNFQKGYYLVQVHTLAREVYFLEEGCAVAFQYHNASRVLTGIWQSGEIVLPVKSFCRQVPSEESIQLTVDSGLFSISFTAVMDLLQHFSAANHLARYVAADYYGRMEKMLIDFHTLDAWERYMKLIGNHPSVEQFLSQDMIASFINITPQSLSRLKHQHHRS